MPGYQTTLFSQLDPDVALEPHVVFLDDSRWVQCLTELQAAKYIALDTEFFGPSGTFKRNDVDYWKATIRLIQIGLPSGLVMVFELGGLLDDRLALLNKHFSALETLRVVIENPTVPKVGMAMATEYTLLRIHHGWRMRCMRDVMLMSQVTWAGVGSKAGRWTDKGFVHSPILKHNLAAICGRLGIQIDKTEQQSDWAGKLSGKQKNYAARDVTVLYPIWKELTARARRDGIMNSFQAECDAQPAFCECRYNGLPIDLETARADLAIWEQVRDGFLAPFRELFPNVNPNSPAQVAQALTDALDVYECDKCDGDYDPLRAEPVGQPLVSTTCKCGGEFHALGKRTFFEKRQIRGKIQDQPSTSDEALIPYKDIWYVNALLEGRSTSTCMNWLRTAIEHAFEEIPGTGTRIRAEFRQIAGGYSDSDEDRGGRGMGRSSASRPINTQNPSNLQPAHEKAGAPSVRRSIRPQPGRRLVVADLSQAHARIAAEWSKDPVMLKAFNNGEDFHIAMTHRAMVAAGIKITFEETVAIAEDKSHPLYKELKSRRLGVKSTNYASLNMSGVDTLQRQMSTMPVPILLDKKETEALIKMWRELYRVLHQAQRTHIRKVNSYRHYFNDIGVEGEYGESRALTGRRLFLVKEYKPARERSDGTWSEPYWSVKATDAVSSIWMMSEADLIKRALGWLVADFDAHPEWEAEFNNFAHDEVDCTCKAEYALAMATCIQKRFHEAMRWAGIVDLPVDEADARPEKLIKENWAAK